jgi:NAD(P)-dependent dehydrogenase (short-subunit alcohol dehydrogenase family)
MVTFIKLRFLRIRPMNTISAKKKIVLISGASGGLGRELVKIFANKGFYVIALDRVNFDFTYIENSGQVISKTVDITDENMIRAIREELDLDNSGLDILISAAGIYDTYPLTEAEPSLFSNMIKVNLMGTVNLVQGLLRPLVRNKGRIIVISSESYKIQALFQPYMISKASLEAYCIAARQELALKGVRLSVVRPGAINTPLLNWMKSPVMVERFHFYQKELRLSWDRSLKMVGRISSPESVALKIFKVATTNRPRRVYLINNDPRLRFVSLLPGSLIDLAVKKLFHNR